MFTPICCLDKVLLRVVRVSVQQEGHTEGPHQGEARRVQLPRPQQSRHDKEHNRTGSHKMTTFQNMIIRFTFYRLKVQELQSFIINKGIPPKASFTKAYMSQIAFTPNPLFGTKNSEKLCPILPCQFGTKTIDLI